MEIQRLPADEAAVRRYAEDLWVPFNRDLEATVDAHALADDGNLVAEQVPWALDKLETTDYRIEVAVDGEGSDESGFGGTPAGFIATNLDPCPSVFDRPGRVIVSDIYVSEPYRGTGLARELVGRAEDRARTEGCPELVLDVDVDNERALGFYRKMGFEPLRHRMTVTVEGLDNEG